MERAKIVGLWALASVSAFLACAVIVSLMREFAKDITYLDLIVIFVLGLISGLAVAGALAVRR